VKAFLNAFIIASSVLGGLFFLFVIFRTTSGNGVLLTASSVLTLRWIWLGTVALLTALGLSDKALKD